jgi:hypothetical protein
MRNLLLRVACLFCVLAAAGCGATATGSPGAARRYHDPNGWVVNVPRGWHVVHFNEVKDRVAAAGAEISNFGPSAPVVAQGYPIQIRANVMPANGLALVIATDSDRTVTHGPVVTSPLPSLGQRGWTLGSAPAGQPYMETLWFRGNARIFLADVKIGPRADPADIKALTKIIESLQFHPVTH